ncbi:hypothetical protein NDU88_006050 [Pleurodeles waltl]|uniref:Uncharacterized protein n=1 Tax=Pleurodeles waltl TaxID=8319 RepID=A0AAV7TVP1_PLEWA|nr:hypothetical protein NDU88_006050 [Pleurodeles waltl]
MGKGDPKQQKLAFDKQKQTPQSNVSTVSEMGACADEDSDMHTNGTAILMELHACFRAVNARFDTIASHWDQMGERLYRHDARMAHSEGLNLQNGGCYC